MKKKKLHDSFLHLDKTEPLDLALALPKLKTRACEYYACEKSFKTIGKMDRYFCCHWHREMQEQIETNEKPKSWRELEKESYIARKKKRKK